MRISRYFSSSMICGAVVALSGAALAQEAAPAAPAEPAPAAEPAPEAAPAEAPAAEAAPAEAPAEEPSGPPAWFRIDSDGLGLQLWAGTTNTIGSLNIATDIYVTGPYGEFDIGPTFSLADGALVLTPMIGVNFDWVNRQLASIVPQFYTIYNGDSLYFESWIQMFLNSIPDYNSAGIQGGSSLYTRDFLLFKATDDFRVGPELELSLALNEPQKRAYADKSLYSLAVGPNISYNAFGDWQGQIIAFLGVEMMKPSKDIDTTDDNLVGRLTYLHYF
jgi:hypothetical protein